jgi:hypothetical protein
MFNVSVLFTVDVEFDVRSHYKKTTGAFPVNKPVYETVKETVNYFA